MTSPIRCISWSREATLLGTDELWSAFQANSYVARVDMRDGTHVLVRLPDGAARWNTSKWVEKVSAAALEARDRSRDYAVIA